MPYDYKKECRALYQPSTSPSVIDVPEMTFLSVAGEGDPNEEGGAYSAAVGLLYALSYTIKMMPKSGWTPENYFPYVVMPLEGFWWFRNRAEMNFRDKSNFCWDSVIRQPSFVNQVLFEQAREAVARKRPDMDVAPVSLVEMKEGLCVQCMHIGSFDEEKATIEKMMSYINENGFLCDLSDVRRHHEIYLSDPRKTDVSKRKTIIRYPVREA